ncbi:hypothetical protein BofuT4_P123290.1 [Botrytis cinerea T4]|uniref:Uncharacterized protein n=1 Tax=Botryotinia fuckeliana (strain T4) TaxID=999810 RepID=G2YNW2_BOTF4|nr:hypothetical protein BofuT4_P123290.1 [Botrytis cinerea T4]
MVLEENSASLRQWSSWQLKVIVRKSFRLLEIVIWKSGISLDTREMDSPTYRRAIFLNGRKNGLLCSFPIERLEPKAGKIRDSEEWCRGGRGGPKETVRKDNVNKGEIFQNTPIIVQMSGW